MQKTNDEISNTSPIIEALLKRAKQKFEEKQYATAFDIYKEILEQEPTMQVALIIRTEVYTRLELDLINLVKNDPENKKAYFLLVVYT